MSLPNDVYGHTVSMTTDSITDSYFIGETRSYTFPAGTDQSIVYLSISKAENLLLFNSNRLDYILARYSRDQQIQLMIMYEAAVKGSFSNRANYIAQILTWVNQITTYAASFVASVQAQSDPAAVTALVWDPTQFAADPGVTMLAAIQIPN